MWYGKANERARGGQTYLVVGEHADGADEHRGVCYELLELRELWGVMVADELKRANRKRGSQYLWKGRRWSGTALCTTRISLSTSTERLFACTMRLYSGFKCAGSAIAAAVDGFASYFSISWVQRQGSA